DTIADDLGATWNILDVTFKPYPVCAFNQAPAMLGVRLRESGVAAEHVASIRLGMNEREAMYPGMPSRGPFTSTSHTLMSARFAFATALVCGDITYESLHHFTDPQILDLIARIDLVPEPTRPAKTARATVTLHDGTTVDDAIEDCDALLSWTMGEVVANAERLAAEAHLSAQELSTLIESVNGLDHARRLDPVIAAALAGAAVRT
ncbi:hypothetical protein, partial [Mycobacterium sp.]|uniref:hypothetical protein n=1 Tax=Mycobacterium sp. TaxID=1785 RepID=UPI002CF4B9E3